MHACMIMHAARRTCRRCVGQHARQAGCLGEAAGAGHGGVACAHARAQRCGAQPHRVPWVSGQRHLAMNMTMGGGAQCRGRGGGGGTGSLMQLWASTCTCIGRLHACKQASRHTSKQAHSAAWCRAVRCSAAWQCNTTRYGYRRLRCSRPPSRRYVHEHEHERCAPAWWARASCVPLASAGPPVHPWAPQPCPIHPSMMQAQHSWSAPLREVRRASAHVP